MNDSVKSSLFAPIHSLPFVTAEREVQLNRLGIYRVFDLLFYFPREYRNRPRFARIADLKENQEQTTYGRVADYRRRPTRNGSMTAVSFEDDRGDILEAVWFNQPNWMYSQIQLDRRALITGKPVWKNGDLQMVHPTLLWLDDTDDLPFGMEGDAQTPEIEDPQLDDTLYPVYPLTEGLKQFQLHRILKRPLELFPDQLDEVFPLPYLKKHKLLPITEAVRKIHLPKDHKEADAARRRFIYQEFLLLQLALSIRRQQHEVGLKAPVLPNTPQIEKQISRLIPFDLTGAQKRVIGEIAADMARPVPMNRLLQGDVGSGKTIVAASAMLRSVLNGYQAVIMAPTEVLARQHYRFLKRFLESEPSINVVPLLGGQKTKERAEILFEIENGTAGIIVGTQAIVCNEIKFHQLGLVVIDEQHKFGVRQRARLKTGTNADPHYLVMTATPIPRSMTMTVFGDLDISVLDELPPGRQPVKTFVVDTEDHRIRWWEFFRRKIQEGRQGYVVVSRVDETDDGLKNVHAAYDELSAGPLAGIRIGVIHGRMSADEKDAVMADFRSRELEVLVATSVIEVGIDVPNATLMAIENANMFGLAQLHQLRGRIGRGKYPGFCGVFKSAEEEEEEHLPDELPKPRGRSKTKQLRNDPDSRLAVFAHSTDGFFLAEKDFEMRGPGDLFGTEQHGLCHFHIANILRDKKILEEARADAAALVKSDPGLSDSEHAQLRRQVLVRYGKALDLGDVG